MMESSGMNLVMTVIGFAVSTLFIVFVCTRLICARIQHRASRRSFQRFSRSDLSTVERGSNGLEAPIVAKFPAKSYIDEHFSSAEEVQCPICLADYGKEDILRILPHCGHYFHINCIDIWLLQNSTCPVCRVSLREAVDKKRSMQPLFCSRTQLGVDSSNIHTYNCLLAARGFSSRTSEGSPAGRSNVDEENPPSNSREHDYIEEARETISSPEGNCSAKDSDIMKHVKSPSSNTA